MKSSSPWAFSETAHPEEQSLLLSLINPIQTGGGNFVTVYASTPKLCDLP